MAVHIMILPPALKTRPKFSELYLNLKDLQSMWVAETSILRLQKKKLSTILNWWTVEVSPGNCRSTICIHILYIYVYMYVFCFGSYIYVYMHIYFLFLFFNILWKDSRLKVRQYFFLNLERLSFKYKENCYS